MLACSIDLSKYGISEKLPVDLYQCLRFKAHPMTDSEFNEIDSLRAVFAHYRNTRLRPAGHEHNLQY